MIAYYVVSAVTDRHVHKQETVLGVQKEFEQNVYLKVTSEE